MKDKILEQAKNEFYELDNKVKELAKTKLSFKEIYKYFGKDAFNYNEEDLLFDLYYKHITATIHTTFDCVIEVADTIDIYDNNGNLYKNCVEIQYLDELYKADQNYYNTKPLSKKEVIDLLKKSEFTVIEPRKKIRILCVEDGSVDEATMESIKNGEDLDGSGDIKC